MLDQNGLLTKTKKDIHTINEQKRRDVIKVSVAESMKASHREEQHSSN